MTCKCPECSPFRWKEFPRDSIFMGSQAFRAKGENAMSAAQIASEVVRKKRKQDKSHGTIRGLIKTDDQLKPKRMNFYSKAGVK